ncbi:hypothetical protein [Streptomyces rubellomurinus]|uniref:hypothetical protein n=1 Tax=Streptomyces rubellomurinus (strain ATCC 31215) TaxID=359131 RepID=UPI000A859A7D|nr:hypothetical protein [Streptomyces rubellomurinus]
MKIATADSARRLVELEPIAEELMNRHLVAAREWFPHQYVPWGPALRRAPRRVVLTA